MTTDISRNNRLDVLEEISAKLDNAGTDPAMANDISIIEAKIPELIDGRSPVELLGKLGKAYELTAGAVATSQVLTSTVTRIRLLVRTSNVRIAVGASPQIATTTTNTTTSHLMLADTSMDIACSPNSVVSVIRDTGSISDGIVNISELV